jgi:hypothetical protein
VTEGLKTALDLQKLPVNDLRGQDAQIVLTTKHFPSLRETTKCALLSESLTLIHSVEDLLVDRRILLKR